MLPADADVDRSRWSTTNAMHAIYSDWLVRLSTLLEASIMFESMKNKNNWYKYIVCCFYELHFTKCKTSKEIWMDRSEWVGLD